MPLFSCAPLTRAQILHQIPFVLSLLMDTTSTQVQAMFGVGSCAHNVWSPVTIPLSRLPEWVDNCVQSGIFEPGDDDLYIWDGERLDVRFYHESGINMTTTSESTIGEFVAHWLSLGFRIIRQDGNPPTHLTWHTVQSVADALNLPKAVSATSSGKAHS